MLRLLNFCLYHNLSTYLITQMLSGLRAVFNSGKTKPYAWRNKQLLGMLKLFDENRDKITQALKEDLRKVGCFKTVIVKPSQMSKSYENLKNKIQLFWSPDTQLFCNILYTFMPPVWKVRWGHLVIGLSLCTFCMFVHYSTLLTY